MSDIPPHRIINSWKEAGLKIVFTNGCFDLIHPGHISFLNEAKTLGDRLIVGINSDSSVKTLKGSNRPIFTLADRIRIISSLSTVSLVIPFTEKTPKRLIEQIIPDILVKGGDYKSKNIVGSKFVLNSGGIVKTLKFEKGYSTTELMKRIKS